MLKTLTNLLIIMTMLFTFIGQAAAYHFIPVIQKDSDPHLSSTQVQLQEFPELHTQSEEQDDCCEIDCCETECICPSNACIAFVYLNSNSRPANASAPSELVFVNHIGHPNNLSDTLYRPPIFSS
ncbi:hypothetical protein [Pseudoalteromonas luteoviolacea]|uniref:hypothetical protein n=1 Tax=Pseudoalteromonas luteoviolacea TaxID=43657 RepID=UPI001154EE53|nr:hypothetical protein [Pseudoalteromonas luteoviolacea]TQF70094.1 hypothetical protein FLM44_03095 [Pseudoalteromonas luteoviolacea]